MDILIEKGTILTVNSDFDIIQNGVVGIQGDKICLVAERTDHAAVSHARRRIDADGGIVLPGLINTHTHLPMTLFRGLADDLLLTDWLEKHIFPAENRFINPASIDIGVRLACAEMIRSGTTTCCDGYFLEGNVAQAVCGSGLRAVLGQGVIDFAAPGIDDPTRNIHHAKRFLQTWLDAEPLIHPAVFCHSPYTCSPDTLKRAKHLAERFDVLFQIHVAETRDEYRRIPPGFGNSPIDLLSRLDVLDPRTLLVHCVWIDESDIDIIVRSGAGISHNPDSNLKLASGIAPIPQMIDAGLKVGLGTDGCASNNTLDMFKAMDFAAKIHKVSSRDPTVMDAETVLKTATIDAAGAIGLENRIGSLEVGKQADVIIVDTRQPHLTPTYNPVSHLVYAACGADVATSIIAGKVVMENRELKTIDVERVMWEADQLASKIKNNV